jgi:UDP-glucose 4-epimerase
VLAGVRVGMDLRGKRVLVTGGLGFIGSNLAHKCLEMGAHVTIYDCLDPRSGGNMHNVADIKDRCTIVLNDIRNFEGVSPVVRENDVLFNCAAYTSHPSSMKDPLNDIDVNCKGVINLLEAARRFNPEMRIVHVGTSTQIGRMRHSPIDEDHPEFPVDIYSANKTASEKYVLVYANAYGLPASVIRLANTYGPRSNVRSPDFGFVNYFIGLALQGKELPVFGKGEQLRTLTYVDDCVDALVLAATDAKADGKTLFAVADQQYSVRDLAESIVKAMRSGSVRYVDWPKDREAIEVGDAVISAKRIHDTLGWRSRIKLEDGLERTRAYFAPALKHYLR